MQWIKSGIENPSKSEVFGRCGGDEKHEWPRSTDKSRTLKKFSVDGIDIQTYPISLSVPCSVTMSDIHSVTIPPLYLYIAV